MGHLSAENETWWTSCRLLLWIKSHGGNGVRSGVECAAVPVVGAAHVEVIMARSGRFVPVAVDDEVVAGPGRCAESTHHVVHGHVLRDQVLVEVVAGSRR